MRDEQTRIALVSGANKGIGFETARQLADLGVLVLLGARDARRGQAAAEELAGSGAQVRCIPLDVTQQESVRAAAAEIDRDFGRLDILVNNAGIGLDLTPASALDTARLRETMETNFFGAFSLLQAMTPLLRNSPAGRVVNVSSALGSIFHVGNPEWMGVDVTFPGYSMSKAALNMMTATFAAEFRRSAIKINSVEPGYTRTDMTSGQGFQTADAAAATIVKYATCGEDGPNGGFFQASGPLPW